jgi:pimeloyl-ACP methyl ester carboxylesterase
MLLHASGGSPRHWSPITASLPPRMQVLTPALAGYDSREPWPVHAPLSIDDEADRLAPLLRAQPVHLVGHSYGGAVALQLALRWPQQVLSLTVFEPVRFALLRDEADTAASSQHIISVGRRIGAEVMDGRPSAAAERFVDYWSGPGSWLGLTPPQQDTVVLRMPKVRAEFEALFADRVPASAYRGLHLPVHLIGGSRSPLPARQVMARLAGLLPLASGVTLPGVGHMGPVTHPDRVSAHLPPWLQTLAMAAAA